MQPNLGTLSYDTPIIATISPCIITPTTTKTAQQSNLPGSIQESNRSKLTTKFPAKTVEGIEGAITQFNKLIQKAAWRATPDDKPESKYQEYS
jgi:hypothetical protein